ncbi:family 43 glycosylhydrolase [Bacteroides sp.]|uniref:family 43 glycosylhydrolase n=1 Tax=Bacteroides sp. TaxID=29523 RepID=UPI0025C6FCB5|nr:family 43 glycosylhydrolase [Bacteroides sp.]
MNKFITAFFLGWASLLSAQNPLVTHMYTADPTARCFDGKLYVYPSSDAVPIKELIKANNGFCMPGYHGFSFEGGSSWKDHGWILKENDVPWGEKDTYAMWAPDCIKKDGKYYYYFPAKAKNDNAFRRIGVGVSDNPMGPFKWEKSFIEGIQGIDPGLFVDDDNQAYLYYGGGQKLYGVKLSDDMKSIDGEPVEIQSLPFGYKEGSFLFKKDGVYYFTFAHVFPDEGYTIGYATSNNPLGPFEYKGKIMDNIDNGTNHHSVVKYNDKWILFYHFWHISGCNKLRSMCADYMEFKPDGTIKKVVPTLRGIGNPAKGDTIQVDRYNEISNASISFVSGDEPMGWMVCEARTGSTVRFNGVDFGNGEAKKMQARVSCGNMGCTMEVRIGHQWGKVVAKYEIKNTGGWGKWVTLESDILEQVKGKQDIFIRFFSTNGSTKTANLNWLLME